MARVADRRMARGRTAWAAVVVLFVLAVMFLPASRATAQPSVPSSRLTSRVRGAGVNAVVAAAPTPDGEGFWEVSPQGVVTTQGDAAWFGDLSGVALSAPIVSIAATDDGGGYWLLGADGGVFSFGDAQFFGSTGGSHLNSPALQIVSTPDSGGYWFVAGDGGVFTFGDAGFFGSTGNIVLNQPVVGMSATGDGQGYWLVARDGGIFNFGDAGFFGSTGNIVLNQPVVGMSATGDDSGYWLVAADGGLFNFGDATFLGSAVGDDAGPFVSMVATGDGGGYWIINGDGNIYAFGDATAVAPSCPTGAQLYAAWLADSQLYDVAPEANITGFYDGECWSTYVVATPMGNGNGQFVFSTVGGLHALSAAEFATFTDTVCDPDNGAPSWLYAYPGSPTGC
jgi:hypothetical protein